jgi:hypothetical protein
MLAIPKDKKSLCSEGFEPSPVSRMAPKATTLTELGQEHKINSRMVALDSI